MRTSLAFLYEQEFWNKETLVIGIDEVGKGALSGPVYAGAFCFNPLVMQDNITYMETLGINDSKKLSAKKREELYDILTKGMCHWGIGYADVSYINSKGISLATKYAIHQALISVLSQISTDRVHMVVDGYGFITKDNEGRSYNLEGVVKGDGSILSIAAASILAKVTRDKYMCELSSTYPQYQYEKHKGYGTLVHRNAIKKWGISPQHRELFVRNIKAL